MIKVHIWNYRGLKTAMGHASMHVGANYISWWPAGTNRRFKLLTPLGRAVPLYSVDHIHGQSFDDDRLLEALDSNSVWDATLRTFVDSSTGLMVKPMDPDHTVTLDGLDETRILDWWSTFNVPGRQWSTLGQNCATTVGRGLMMGGGDDYALGASGLWHSWNMVWQPNDALSYAQAIARGLGVRAGEHDAINFVRRFVTSPLGFTSVSWNVDEEAMADAIYKELGVRVRRVQKVFNELHKRRNTDADDVAELYVNKLQKEKGPPLGAVSKDGPLKAQLITILDDGWTSSGQKACIDFLNKLK